MSYSRKFIFWKNSFSTITKYCQSAEQKKTRIRSKLGQGPGTVILSVLYQGKPEKSTQQKCFSTSFLPKANEQFNPRQGKKWTKDLQQHFLVAQWQSRSPWEIFIFNCSNFRKIWVLFSHTFIYFPTHVWMEQTRGIFDASSFHELFLYVTLYSRYIIGEESRLDVYEVFVSL